MFIFDLELERLKRGKARPIDGGIELDSMRMHAFIEYYGGGGSKMVDIGCGVGIDIPPL